MDLEVNIPIEYKDQMIVTVDESSYASLGWKRYKDVGVFEYDWTHLHMTREDIETLIKCLEFTRDHMKTLEEAA